MFRPAWPSSRATCKIVMYISKLESGMRPHCLHPPPKKKSVSDAVGVLMYSENYIRYNIKNQPVVTYGCEAWTLTDRDGRHLKMFERRILRKVFGPVQNEDGSWRIRMNYELNKLIENADIVRFIKSRRIAWLGHVMRVDDKRTHKRILGWKPIGTGIRGRPRKRWIVDIEEDMQIMGIRR